VLKGSEQIFRRLRCGLVVETHSANLERVAKASCRVWVTRRTSSRTDGIARSYRRTATFRTLAGSLRPRTRLPPSS
jgi:hypothetical protein